MTLGQIIEQSPKLKRLGVVDETTQVDLYKQWEAAAGPAVARNAHPLRVRKGCLELAVHSPAWMQELVLMKPLLLEKINQALGSQAVHDLRLVLSEKRS